MGLSSSSRLVAADSIWNWAASPAFSTKSFITNSAIGLRQIFPWHTKSIFFILRCPPTIIFALSIANEPPSVERKICKKDSVSRQNVREMEPFQKIISLPGILSTVRLLFSLVNSEFSQIYAPYVQRIAFLSSYL